MAGSAKSRGKFRGIAEAMRSRIGAGDWKTGELVPSEAELVREYSVARGTVRAALLALEEEGLIQVVPGRGRMVRDRLAQPVDVHEAEEFDLASALRARLGDFAEGAAFLSERAVMDEYRVSRHAARRALSALESGGFLSSQQGRRRTVRLGLSEAKDQDLGER
jgi:DNA-binding GntR family transcriptional regulator